MGRLAGVPVPGVKAALAALLLKAAVVVPAIIQAQESTAPTVLTTAITSDPGTDNAYATTNVITVSVTFSEAVTVTGTPQVTLDIGGTERTADYSGDGSETGELLFNYTVVAEDVDDDGITLKANSLALNGGTIRAADDSADADLAHEAMDFPDHKVNPPPPIAANVEDSLHNVGETVSEYTTDYVAQQFTASINPGGFSLVGVRLRLGDFTDGEISVTIREDDGGAPGDVIVVLTNPDPLVANSINVFTDPDQAQLAQQTRYWIVVNEGIGAGNLIPVAGTTSTTFVHRGNNAELGLPEEERADALLWSITAHSSRRASESDEYEQSATLLMFGLRTRVNADETGFTCHQGDSHVESIDVAFLSIVEHDSQPRILEGADIAVSVRSNYHGIDSCQGEPEAPWRFRLTVTHTVPSGTANRVAEEHITVHEGSIHRNAQTFTLTIPTIDNVNAEQESYVDVELSVPAEYRFAPPDDPGGNRILAITPSKRYALYDNDQYILQFTQPCDQEFIDVDEGEAVQLQVQRTPPSGYRESVLVQSITGSATSRDFTRTDGILALLFEPGQEFATFTMQTTEDGVLENAENFEVQMFCNGCDDRSSRPVCPAGRQTAKVRILDDDDMTIDMGPQTRTVAAGQAVRFAPEFARYDSGCDIPFPFFLDFEVGDEDGLVVDHSAATTGRTLFCTNRIRGFTMQTVRPPCSSPGTREIRLTPRFWESDAQRRRGDPLTRPVFMEHDEYVIVLEDDLTRTAWTEGFRTGSHAQGYRIVGAQVETLAAGLPSSLRKIDIYPANDAGEPDGWRQWPLRLSGGNRYDPDEPMRLEPDTDYLIVIHAGDALGTRSAANDRTDVQSVADQSGFSFGGQYTQLQRCSTTHRSFGEWTQEEEDDLIWMSLELTELDPPAATASEPADAAVDWKTSLTVGQWIIRHRERERGWRVDWCWQTREDTADIEDHYEGDICYGSIADRDFDVGSASFELEGVWHMVAYGSHSVVLEFEQQEDITPLLDRTFILNGREFAVADRREPRGARTTTDRIVWEAKDWNSVTGWPVGSTVWVALQAQTGIAAQSAPQAWIVRADDGPVHGEFGVRLGFSENVEGFDASDIAVDNGSLVAGTLSAESAGVWVARIAPAASGPVTVSVARGAARFDGLDSLAAEPLTVEADLSAPVLSLSTPDVSADDPPTGQFTVRAEASKRVSSLNMDDLQIEGGAVMGLLSRAGGRSWDILVSPAEGASEVAVQVPAAAVADLAGRPNPASNRLVVRLAATDSEQSSSTPGRRSEPSQAEQPDQPDKSAHPIEQVAAGQQSAALTASVSAISWSRSPGGLISFELRFSPEPQLSYVSLRDHAFSVTGGVVIRARRLTRGDNSGWQITIRPSATNRVSILLPVTVTCAAHGAICTESGSPFANQLSFSVNRP